MPDDGQLREGGPEPSGHGQGEGWDEEHELRILLERAVPRLPAPDGRLRRVRERAARGRRRRRVAGTAAVAVTGLVVLGTLLPGVLLNGGRDEGAPPASPAPTVTATGTGGGRAVRFPDLIGLTLRVPHGWQALAAPGDPARKLVPRGYVASRQVPDTLTPNTVTPTCAPEPETGCDPVSTLLPGSVLVSLDLKKFSGLHTKTQDPPTLDPMAEPSLVCGKLLGTEEYSALLAGPEPSADVGIQVSVCVAGPGPSSPIVDEVRAMIAGAEYPPSGATPEASRAPTAQARNTWAD